MPPRVPEIWEAVEEENEWAVSFIDVMKPDVGQLCITTFHLAQRAMG